jgi:hypothetical protein
MLSSLFRYYILMRIILPFYFFFISSISLYAQGIRGYVLSEQGDTLPFASVFVPQSGKGVSGNTNGYYEMRLNEGRYAVVSQYVGYQNKEIEVDIMDKQWRTVNFILLSTSAQLKMVEVRAGDEDPAYAIMHKAIAKSKYHLMMYDAYSCKVYTKGTGMVTEAPYLIRRQLEKENINLNRAFTSESLSEIHFQQPDSLHEKVIAIRKVGNEGTTSPNSYINASFYAPMVVGAVSPLAPSAFFYYKFGYRGSFEESGHTIYKISVVPKTRGMDTYSGFIYIIDGLYAIHSLELQTYFAGFEVKINQLYQPVKENCWMPVNHRIDFKGKVMGVGLQYNYVANVDDYEVTLNESVRAKQINLDKERIVQAGDAEKEVIMDKKTLRRELKKLEKERRSEQEDKSVVRYRSMEFDSAVYDMEEDFWKETRPIPLTEVEVEGYKISDSIAKAEESGEDSIKAFNYRDVLFGGRYKLSKKTQLRWHSPIPLLGFNTVEGMVIQGRASMRYKLDTLNLWSLRSEATYRYGTESNTHYFLGKTELYKEGWYNDFSLSLSGGHFIRQFNRERPISPLVNTIHTLFFRENFIKLYEDTYLRLAVEKSYMRKLDISGGIEISERNPLTNNTNYSFFFRNARVFTANQPEGDIPMEGHRAWLADVKLTCRPFLKYTMRGRLKQPLLYAGDPLFFTEYRNGIYNTGDAFHHLRSGYAHEVRFGVSGTLEWNLSGGTFFGSNPQFPDARHFLGNQTFFAPLRDMEHFRLMPYYDYSTSGTYGQLMTRYTFRKLLVTQFFYPRMMGAQEQFFLNGMMSEGGNQYLEAGYSLQNLFRIFRVDLGTLLHPETGKFGIMIGLGGFIQFE